MTKKFQGYQISEEDIDSTLRFLTNVKKQQNVSREDAIRYLEEKQAQAHIVAHKVVEDEQTGKIDKQKSGN